MEHEARIREIVKTMNVAALIEKEALRLAKTGIIDMYDENNLYGAVKSVLYVAAQNVAQDFKPHTKQGIANARKLLLQE